MRNLKQELTVARDNKSHRKKNSIVPEQPGPSLAGFYLLTADGKLARFGSGGDLEPEPELSAVLAFRLKTVLDQYRSGNLRKLSLGLATGTEFGQSWDKGAIVFRDQLLGRLFESEPAGETLSSYTERNKSKTVFQGMELLLTRKNPHQPLFPRFCPVLLVPEVDSETLCARYGVPFLESRELFEILDLFSPSASRSQPPKALVEMVEKMRLAQTEAVCLNLDSVSTSGMDARAQPGAGSANSPMDIVASDVAGTFFNEGDTVTGWLLEWFSPFNELTDTQRDIVAGYETIRKAPAGATLIESGQPDANCICLVEGTLALSDPDGQTIHVTGGTRRSRLPISVLNPHAYTVTAVTEVSIVVFSESLIRKINEITRTYTSSDQADTTEASTTEISNGVQAAYLNRTSLSTSGSS